MDLQWAAFMKTMQRLLLPCFVESFRWVASYTRGLRSHAPGEHFISCIQATLFMLAELSCATSRKLRDSVSLHLLGYLVYIDVPTSMCSFCYGHSSPGELFHCAPVRL
jgi:hypothetical protein